MPKHKDGDTGEFDEFTWPATIYGSRLLTELRVANVKSLAGEHVIPLAPLTLLFGPNASGKTSILQSLLLLAQSVNADDFMPRGPLIDVRDFRLFVNAHDTSKELAIGVRFMIEEENDGPRPASLANEDMGGVPSIKFEGGVTLTFYIPDSWRSPALRSSLSIGGAALVEPYPDPPVAEGEDDDGRPYGPYYLRWKVDLSDSENAELLAKAIEVMQPGYQDARGSAAVVRYASELVQAGHASSAALEHWVDPEDWGHGLHAPSSFRLALEPSEAPRPGDIAIEGRGLLPTHVSDAEKMCAQWATDWPDTAVFQFPRIGVFERVEEEARGLLHSRNLGEDSAPAARRYSERRSWSRRPEAQIVSLGPIRPTPQRLYIEEGVADTAAQALIRRLFQDKGLLAGVNEWFERLEIPYSVSVDRLVSQRSGEGRGYLFELSDTRTGVDVSLADVGYGVSQVLPIVTECLGSSSSVICIEQPELHLHPRLAADLAELLVESATRGNQILAETHSESMLLRVQRLVREGRIAADDVAVLYVDNVSGTGARVSRLRLDVEGDLVDRWPGGFFDDRLADALGIPS